MYSGPMETLSKTLITCCSGQQNKGGVVTSPPHDFLHSCYEEFIESQYMKGKSCTFSLCLQVFMHLHSPAHLNIGLVPLNNSNYVVSSVLLLLK